MPWWPIPPPGDAAFCVGLQTAPDANGRPASPGRGRSVQADSRDCDWPEMSLRPRSLVSVALCHPLCISPSFPSPRPFPQKLSTVCPLSTVHCPPSPTILPSLPTHFPLPLSVLLLSPLSSWTCLSSLLRIHLSRTTTTHLNHSHTAFVNNLFLSAALFFPLRTWPSARSTSAFPSLVSLPCVLFSLAHVCWLRVCSVAAHTPPPSFFPPHPAINCSRSA